MPIPYFFYILAISFFIVSTNLTLWSLQYNPCLHSRKSSPRSSPVKSGGGKSKVTTVEKLTSNPSAR